MVSGKAVGLYCHVTDSINQRFESVALVFPGISRNLSIQQYYRLAIRNRDVGHGRRRGHSGTIVVCASPGQSLSPCRSVPETGFGESRRYWGGKWGERWPRRRHYACGRRCTNDGQRRDGLIQARPPSSRPKTPYFDSSRIRFDDGLSVVFDSGPFRPVSGEQRAFHVLMNGGYLWVAARRWPSAARG